MLVGGYDGSYLHHVSYRACSKSQRLYHWMGVRSCVCVFVIGVVVEYSIAESLSR